MMRKSLIALLSAAWMTSGCGSSERPTRQEIYRPDDNVQQIPVSTIDRFVDRCAQDAARTIANLPDVRNARTKLVLALAPIDNASTVCEGQLEQALISLHGRLAEAEQIRSNFVILDGTYDSERSLLDFIEGPPALVGSPTGGDVVPKRYPLETYRLLKLVAIESGTMDNRVVQLQVKLSNPVQRQMLFSRVLNTSLRWDSSSATWQTTGEETKDRK